MKRLHNRILKYLYDNDGKYVDLYSRFLARNVTRETIDLVCKDMSTYIEIESIYEQRGLLIIGSNTQSQKNRNEKLNVRINQQGRERYEQILSRKQINIPKIVIGAIITFSITFIIPFVIDSVKESSKVIPHINLLVENQTDDDLKISSYQEFYLWLPGSLRHLSGNYEILSNEDDVIDLPRGKTLLKVNILNNKGFFDYYQAGECTISLSVRVNGKLIISKDFLPFNSRYLNKYTTKIVISKN